MGSLFPSPRVSCVEAGLHRALFTTQRTYKDQSEQHGGRTSERRKERQGQRGRKHGKKTGRRRGEEGRNRKEGRVTGRDTHSCIGEWGEGVAEGHAASHPHTAACPHTSPLPCGQSEFWPRTPASPE